MALPFYVQSNSLLKVEVEVKLCSERESFFPFNLLSPSNLNLKSLSVEISMCNEQFIAKLLTLVVSDLPQT